MLNNYMNHRSTVDEDLAEVRRAHDFDSGDAPYQPEVLAMARAAERLADEVERLRTAHLPSELGDILNTFATTIEQHAHLSTIPQQSAVLERIALELRALAG